MSKELTEPNPMLEDEPIIKLTNAVEAKLDKLYWTYDSNARYLCRLIKLDLVKHRVMLSAYQSNTQEWRAVFVPNDYKLRELDAETSKAALEGIEGNAKKERARAQRAAGRTPRAPGAGRPTGKISGLGMLATWGKYFAEYAHQEGQREKIRTAMLEEFPEKTESINKWLDAYRAYYNKGKFPGIKLPETNISTKEWNPSDVQA